MSLDLDKARFPLGKYLGMQLRELGAGRVEISLEAGERHQNPNGVVYGGVLFAMVDTAMGAATMSVLEQGKACASIDLNIRFLRSVTAGKLRAEAEVIQPGRRIVHLDARVYHGERQLAATATGSFAVIEND